MTVFVVGRFPPPIDGQALATERLADLLENAFSVRRINTEPPLAEERGVRRLVRRGLAYVGRRPQIREELRRHPRAAVVWPAVSPDPLGHFRDLWTTLPAFEPDRAVVAAVHRGNFQEVFESPLTSRTALGIVRRVNAFVFLTELLSDRCAQWIPAAERFVIPNTIDDDLIFSDADVARKRRARREHAHLRVLFVGHMLPSKGYLDVLSAIGILRQTGRYVEGHFAGGWSRSEDRRQFLDRVSALGLADRIVHHGAVHDRAAVKSLYEEADLLLLPTTYRNEAQPLVIIEAMNAGVPIVTTKHAGIPEMMRHGEEGLFVPASDPEALADAVARLSEPESWLEASTAARRRYLERFAPEVVRSQWEQLIDSLPPR